MKKTPFYLSEEGIRIVTETANDIAEAKGYASRVHEGDVTLVVQALYILQKVMKKK